MQPGSLVAIYFLVFVATAFISLPFGVKTDEEVGNELVPGQAQSAPHTFDLKRHLLRAAIISVFVTALIVANYYFGWIEMSDFDSVQF